MNTNTVALRIIKTCILLISIFSLFFCNTYAYTPYDDIRKHDGMLCIKCHEKYPDEVIPDVIKNFPCFKRACHYSAPEWGGNRYQIHCNNIICKVCHSTGFEEYNTHTVHKNKVPCKTCHMSPRGWNSSIVIIPASEKVTVYGELTLYVPESGNCSYCHLINGGERLHDVHKSILKSNLSCIQCHGEIITIRTDLMGEFFNNSENININTKKPETIPIRELSRLFEEIRKVFVAITMVR